MSPDQLLLGGVVFAMALLLADADRSVFDVGVALCVCSLFVTALSGKESTGLLRLSTGCRTAAVALCLAEGARRVMRAKLHGLNLAFLAAAGLLFVITARNVVSVETTDALSRPLVDTVNPWGLASTVAIIVGALASSMRGRDVAIGLMPRIVVLCSIVLLGLELCVVFELLPGNVGKLATDAGGAGLANMSTNETATFAVALLLSNVSARRCGATTEWASWTGVFSCVAVTALTRSRLGILLAGAVIAAELVSRARKSAARMFVLAPVAVMMGTLVVSIVVSRTAAESDQSLLTNAYVNETILTAPGSGRPFIWQSLLSAFWDTARQNPTTLMMGRGPMAVADYYQQTRLSELGFRLPTINFLPTHSDALTILLTCGASGIALWATILVGTSRLIAVSSVSLPNRLAILAFIAISTVDMVSYVPAITAVLWGVATTLPATSRGARRRSMGPRFIPTQPKGRAECCG